MCGFAWQKTHRVIFFAALDRGLLHQGHLHQAEQVEGAALLHGLHHHVGQRVAHSDDVLAGEAVLKRK